MNFTPYSFHSHFATLRSSLTPDATIILQSCSNAAACGKDDFAGFIQSIAPPRATVYAATQPFNLLVVQSGTPPEARMFIETENERIDVTYRSGSNGYCNNPFDPGEVHKHKLKDINLLIPLVESDQFNRDASNIATEAFKSMDFWTRFRAICLFEKLFNKGQGFEAAISAVDEAFKGADSLIQIKALELFKELETNEQAFEAALSAATEDFISTVFPYPT